MTYAGGFLISLLFYFWLPGIGLKNKRPSQCETARLIKGEIAIW
jgi:hypothetical protein